MEDVLLDQLDVTTIPKSIHTWLLEAEKDVKVTEDNYIEKQMEQGNICLKYVRYKYKYAVLLEEAKKDLDQFVAEKYIQYDKGSKLTDEKYKLRLIQADPDHLLKVKHIARLQAVFDMITDTLKVADKIGYCVNNIISENNYKLKLERGI